MVIILSGGLAKLFLTENNKMTSSQNLEKGAHNLLKNCANFLENKKVQEAWQILHLGKII